MAKEVAVNFSISATKGNLVVTGSGNFQGDQSGSNGSSGQTQNIGTSAEALTWGEATYAGYFIIVNLDQTNYMELSMANDGTNPFARLQPAPSSAQSGGFALVPAVPSVTYYAKAHTGACQVLKIYTEL